MAFPNGCRPLVSVLVLRCFFVLAVLSCWNAFAQDFTLTASPSNIIIPQGAKGICLITTSVSGGFNAPITLTSPEFTDGINYAAFDRSSIAAPGAGTAIMELNVFRLTPGTYPKTVTASGGGKTHTLYITITITSSVYKGIFAGHCPPDGCQLASQTSVTFNLPGGGTFAVSASPASTAGTSQLISPYLMQLQPSVTINLNGSGVKATAPSSSNGPFSLELVAESDDGTQSNLPTSQICSNSARQDGVKAGDSVQLSVFSTCTWPAMGLYAIRSDEPVAFQVQRLFLRTYGKPGLLDTSPIVTISTLYVFLPNLDWLAVESAQPYAGTLVKSGSTQSFSVGGEWFLGTRDKANLALRIYDQNGVLQATSDFKPVTATSDYNGLSLTIPNFTVPGTATRLDVKAVILDASGSAVIKESVVLSYPISGDCQLSGFVRRSAGGKDYWLPDVPVDLLDASGNKVATVQAKVKGTYPLLRAEYCFPQLPSNLNTTTQYRVQVRLQDADSDLNAKILISPGLDQGAIAVKVVSKPFFLDLNGSIRQDVNIDHASGSVVVSGDFKTTEAAAETYWHMWRQVNLMYPVTVTKALSRDLPIEVYLNGTGPTHYCATNQGTTCLTASSIVLETVDSVPGMNTSVLWHEFGHHVIREFYGGEIPRPAASPDRLKDLNHNGYFNDYTSASIDEGFATFWAVLSNRAFGEGRPGLFYWNTPTPATSQPMSIEENDVVWDYRRTSPDITTAYQPRGEELALAGLLWDLVDPENETETVDGVRVTDEITMDPKDLMGLLATTQPKSFLQLYKALKAKYPDLAAARSNGLSKIDAVFLLHRIFHQNGDYTYYPGKEIGRAANDGPWYGGRYDLAGTVGTAQVDARPMRENLPQVPGSTIAVTLISQDDGQPVDSTGAQIQLVFGPGYENLNRTDNVTLQSGKLYVEMPPSHYSVQAYVSVPGSVDTPLVIDNAWYWSTVGTGDSLMANTFKVPDPVPLIQDVLPLQGAPGETVTVTGSNFKMSQVANVVQIGTARADISSGTTSSIVIHVPTWVAGGVYPLTVTSGKQTSQPVDFTVLAPAASLMATSLDYGSVAVGQSADQTITLSNRGTAPLKVIGVGTTGRFSVTSQVAHSNLDPGGQLTITVRFTPDAARARSGSLLVTTNDPVNRTQRVILTGTGTSPSGPSASVSPDAVDFGSVATSQNRTFSVAVANSGSAAFNVTSVSSTNPSFSLTAPSVPFSVAASGQQSVTLKFAPTTSGTNTGTLSLTANAPGHPSLTIAVQGHGAATTGTCTYALSPASQNAEPEGGAATVGVAAPAGCGFAASSNVSWLVVTAGASGSGNAAVSFTVSPNPANISREGTLTIAGLTATVIQAAGTLSRDVFVPIVLSTAGLNGSFFTSELTLTNRGTTDAIARLTYTAAFGGGSGSGTDVVPAGSQIILKDAIGYLGSVGIQTPSSGSAGGTLGVTFMNLSSPLAASATVRTSTVVPDGRAGLSYPAIPPALLTGPVYISGLRQTANDRSNVAVQNAGQPSAGDVVLRLTVFSGDPANPGSKVLPDVGLAPGGFAQFSGILASNGLNLTNGYVKVERVAGTAPYYAYGVINDQITSDGSFVPPFAEDALLGKSGLTIPVIVETATFSSELVATNSSSTTKTVRFSFLADAVSTSDHTATFPLTLAPGQQRVIPALVQYLRDQHVTGIGPAGPTYTGALFATVDGTHAQGLILGVRTSAPASDGEGRFGLFYMGVPNGAAATSSAWVYGLQQNAENRSNLAIVNTGEVDDLGAAYRIEIYDGDSGLLVKTLETSLPARRFVQFSGILKNAPNTTNGYVRVVKTAGNNPFIAYGVINDGGVPGVRSDDGAFVAMEVER